MAFLPANPDDPFVFDYQAVKDLGKDLASQYASATPFPNIVIDDFLPEPVLQYCLENFPSNSDPETIEFDRDQERFKRGFSPDYLEPRLRSLFYAFNSRPFIRVIENITGIKGLIPDPYFFGAGFHEVRNGGHLSIHADFNHHNVMDLERRVNMLIYLNPDWQPEYGGQLEFWTLDMKEKVHAITPIANRCAMFSTSLDSMHGNPEPVAHPDGKSRRSIALYYYTATWDESRVSKTTQFHRRTGSKDQRDWEVFTDELLAEILPPVISRKARGVARRITQRLGR